MTLAPSDTAWEPAPARPLGRPDLYLVIAIFLFSWITAALYLPAFRASGGVGNFYQDEFGPAVMSACGHGYVSPDLRAVPSLQAFLDRRADTFNCTDLAAHPVATDSLSSMQRAFRYLMMSAALVWKVTGISWAAIDIVLSALFAISLAGGYLALRFVCGRTLAIAGTLLWMASPIHLGNLPHLRDYAKTPFFIVLLIAMAFVVRERRPSRLVLAGALFGLVQGIGLGMRTDVILNFAPFLLVLFAAGSRSLRDQLPAKLACAGVALAVFTIVAWPILHAYGEGEGLSHVALLGLTTPFDEPLGIRRAPYDFGYVYNDSFAAAEVDGNWARSALDAHSVTTTAVPYARASREYYVTLATTFPGDFLSRMASSVIQTLNLPFAVTYGRVPLGVNNGLLAQLIEWRTEMMLSLIGWGPLVAAALLIIVGVSSLRDGLVGAALLLFWAAYPFIQFHGRHTFHLEFLVIAGFMALMSLAVRSAQQAIRGAWPSMMQVARATGLVIALGGASVVAILIARAIQTPRVRTLLDTYAQASTESLPAAAIFDPPDGSSRLQQAMIVADISRSGCAHPPDVVTLRYQPLKDRDFSHTIRIPAATESSELTRVFFPAYAMDLPNGDSSRFTGVEVDPAGSSCVHISRVRGIDHLLWVDATLTPGWHDAPLYQRIYIGTAFPQRLWLKMAHWWPSFATLG